MMASLKFVILGLFLAGADAFTALFFPLAPDLADVGPRGCFVRSASSISSSLSSSSSSSSSVLATRTEIHLPPPPPARRPKPIFYFCFSDKNGGKGEVAGSGGASSVAAATVVSHADTARAAFTTTTTTTSSDAPVLNHAQPCWDSCGKKAGSCPGHCGQRGACSKLGHVAEKEGHNEAGSRRHGAGLGFVLPKPHVQSLSW
eukprot:CAMPEP_0171767088 /NCGR_PEP_ID=MMETSP0991-20121206/51633_1 /TAXON_ID=483369 /ORGANISM="non described non described, Strain CCMP2098" /LENGTH=201 /DNA_ID=CAMNT_0012371855 /DNA_START=274 /DNA_END=879 /DNA_ORIENTATION=-